MVQGEPSTSKRNKHSLEDFLALLGGTRREVKKDPNISRLENIDKESSRVK
jgi:hypothetical protein